MILMKSSYFFLIFQKCSSFFPLILTLEKLCLLFCTFPSFLWCLQKGMFMWHMQNLPSPWWCDEPHWGSPRGTVIHTTQEISLDQSINASRLHAQHHSYLILHLCVFECGFLCERKPGVRSYFLQIIKAQSPLPLFYVVWLSRKASMCESVCWTFWPVVCMIVCVAVL